MLRAVHALGITQITAWGTSYYCLGVLSGPIARDMGWTLSTVTLGFTVSLLIMGMASTAIGSIIDRYGARRVMCAGTVLVSAGLVALSAVQTSTTYYLAWAFLGLAMRMCLYDAAFAALVQVAPSRGRRAISYLTLYGAFASTVFWVVGYYLELALGWRQTLAIFAAINLAVCLPLNWWGLALREDAAASADAGKVAERTPDGPPLEGQARKIGIALFALIMSLNGFVFGVVSLLLAPLLQASGISPTAAVWIASLKGFAQFAGRIVEITFGGNLRAITIARIAIGVLPCSIVLLIFGSGAIGTIILFTLLMGASQGVITIVRGAVPLALFGAKGYGAVLGVIATPVLLVNAASPTVFALISDRWGWSAAETVLLACAAAAWLAMELMSRWYERNRRQVEGETPDAAARSR